MLTALLLLGSSMAAEPLTADDLAWLAGTWVQQNGEQKVEETWTKPDAGTLFGINRTSKAGATTFHEYLRIEPRGGVLAYVALPKGAPGETAFEATEHGKDRVVFTNPTHDFPTSIAYARKDDTLHIEVRGPDGKGFDLDLEKAE